MHTPTTHLPPALTTTWQDQATALASLLPDDFGTQHLLDPSRLASDELTALVDLVQTVKAALDDATPDAGTITLPMGDVARLIELANDYVGDHGTVEERDFHDRLASLVTAADRDA